MESANRPPQSDWQTHVPGILNRGTDHILRCAQAKNATAILSVSSESPSNDTTERSHLPKRDGLNKYDSMTVPHHQLEGEAPITLGYLLASNNRLTEEDLGPKRLSIDKYMPVFLHDVLMLPGSLAQVLGKHSESDIIPRITPAYVIGHCKVVDPLDGEAALLPIRGADVRADGMLVFGQGSKRRASIEEHYGPLTVKTTVQAIIEMASIAPQSDRTDSRKRYRYQPRAITVEAYVPTLHRQAMLTGEILQDWTLESFLKGEYLS